MRDATASILGESDAVIQQTCSIVPNLEAAIRAHLSVADAGTFSVWSYAPDTFAKTTYRGGSTDYSARVAINDRRPQIEYIELLAGPSVFHEHLESRGYGLHHIGYLVDDVDDVSQRMDRAGFPVIQSHVGWGLDGGADGQAAFFDTTALLGYWTEVVRPPRIRRPADSQHSAAT